LSPIVTAGLPTPGPLAAAVAGWLALVALGLLELVEDDLLLPHAASAIASAPSANIAEPPRANAVSLMCLM
jgi:hypothetical protein